MSADLGHEHDDGLEAYLDDLLGPTERSAFERRLERDAELRAQVDAQARVNAALRRRFHAPSAASMLAGIERAGGRPVTAAPRAFRPVPTLAAAAALAVVVLGGWQVWQVFHERGSDAATRPWRSMETVYRDEIREGFQVGWECKNDEEFAFTFNYKLGQPLLLTGLPAGVQSLGLDYTNTITRNTVYLLAKVNGREVLVFADRADADKGHALPPDSRLKLFRRQVGELVLYELTPLEKPAVIEHFQVPATHNTTCPARQ